MVVLAGGATGGFSLQPAVRYRFADEFLRGRKAPPSTVKRSLPTLSTHEGVVRPILTRVIRHTCIDQRVPKGATLQLLWRRLTFASRSKRTQHLRDGLILLRLDSGLELLSEVP